MANGQITSVSPLMQPVTYYDYQHGQPIPWHGINITIPQAETSLAVFSRLCSIAHRILHSPTNDELEDILKELVKLTGGLVQSGHADSDVYALTMCLQMRCEDKISARQKSYEYNEKSMYALFRKKPQRYIPGAKILPPIRSKDGRPDFFLDVAGIFSVAEFKHGDFRERHLYQLQEYMHRFKAQHGYAVARVLKCELPEDVTYVRMVV